MPDLVQTHGHFLFCRIFFNVSFLFFALEFEGGGDEGEGGNTGNVMDSEI